MVVSADWGAVDALLQRWQRDRDGAWSPVGAPMAATLGRSGLAWGLGLHRVAAGPVKREGDGRAPAGVFSIGPAFGYASRPPGGVTWPYRAADARDYFVDDVASPDYNRWRRIPDGEDNAPELRWASCERMRRDDHVYEVGAVVEHNDACVPGAGSAIFLHVWDRPGAPTAGCTALSKQDVTTLLRWLDPAAAPVLVQAPAATLPTLRLQHR